MPTRTLTSPTLEIAYREEGSPDGRPVLLLHGFPDGASSWDLVASSLAEAGYRTIAPFVRGVGGTRFLDPATPRAGDFAALGTDALDLVDGLDLRDLIVVGQDWGSPTAEIVAAFRPERVVRLVKLNWYGVFTMTEMARAQAFDYAQMEALWYVWMLNTPIGEMALKYDRAGFARALWERWSPTWNAAEREAHFVRALPSFESKDWVRVALSAYRSGTTDAESDPRHDELRERLQDPPPVAAPTVLVNGADDGVERSPLTAEQTAHWFPGGFEHRPLAGVGHWPQREHPEAVAAAILGA